VESPFRSPDLTAPGLALIETMLWDGAQFPRLAGHMARLERSARMFGWVFDPVRVRAALTELPAQAARVRLTLAAGGEVAVTIAALPPSLPVWRLGVAVARLVSDDPWLGVKSTRRAAYDAARATLAPGVDEVVFLNQRGEVCDGSITTLFFDDGQGLCTPPLSCGLLPGVLRAELLAKGACKEKTLAQDDLPRVRLWVGNALRGLMPAVWAGGVVAPIR
jgi:4-amino-4-deoxychorismate lyase